MWRRLPNSNHDSYIIWDTCLHDFLALTFPYTAPHFVFLFIHSLDVMHSKSTALSKSGRKRKMMLVHVGWPTYPSTTLVTWLVKKNWLLTCQQEQFWDLKKIQKVPISCKINWYQLKLYACLLLLYHYFGIYPYHGRLLLL